MGSCWEFFLPCFFFSFLNKLSFFLPLFLPINFQNVFFLRLHLWGNSHSHTLMLFVNSVLLWAETPNTTQLVITLFNALSFSVTICFPKLKVITVLGPYRVFSTWVRALHQERWLLSPVDFQTLAGCFLQPPFYSLHFPPLPAMS